MSTMIATTERRDRRQDRTEIGPLDRFGLILGAGDRDIFVAFIANPDREGMAFANMLRS